MVDCSRIISPPGYPTSVFCLRFF